MKTMTTDPRRAGKASAHAAGTGRRLAGRIAGAALLAALALGTTTAAQAARFGVRVVDASGQPVAGASVCVGLPGNFRQFGTAFTDIDGLADLVEVPNVPIVVTVSKTRFAGIRRSQPGRGYDVVRQLTLVEGLPGPRCRAGSSIVANPPVIDVREVAVAGRGAVTMLTPRVTGNPDEYRIGRDDAFGGTVAAWRPFDTTIRLPSALADASSVVLQLRRHEGSSGAFVEASSSVVTVDLSRRGTMPAGS